MYHVWYNIKNTASWHAQRELSALLSGFSGVYAVCHCLSFQAFTYKKKRTLWSLTVSFHQNLNNFTCQFNTQGPPQPQHWLQSSGWWYAPESKCVHILSLVLLGKMLEQCVIASRPRSQAKYVGKASFANHCSCCCQQHHGQCHPPGTLLASVVSRSCGFPVEMW